MVPETTQALDGHRDKVLFIWHEVTDDVFSYVAPFPEKGNVKHVFYFFLDRTRGKK
jgi:hypothetical protein